VASRRFAEAEQIAPTQSGYVKPRQNLFFESITHLIPSTVLTNAERIAIR